MDARTMNGGGGEIKVCPHPQEGVFFATKGKLVMLATKNLVPGASSEPCITVEREDGKQDEYRAWDHRFSKLAAVIYRRLGNVWIKPDARVLYLGSLAAKTVSHVSDIVGPNGVVYALESFPILGDRLEDLARKRANVIPIIGGKVDVICCELPELDQSTILALNASHFLKAGGHFLLLIDASCMDGELPCDPLLFEEMEKLQAAQLITEVGMSLHRFHHPESACVIGHYEKKNAS